MEQDESNHHVHENRGAGKNKKQRCVATEQSLQSFQNTSVLDSSLTDDDTGGFIPQPQLIGNIDVPVPAAAPTCPSWSCRGCGRCGIHHTTPLSGCWACLKVMMHGSTFDADRWGNFNICQQMKAERIHAKK